MNVVAQAASLAIFPVRMGIFIGILLGIWAIVAFLMMLVILMQRPKSEGLGAAFGGAVTENLFGAQTTNVLVKFTAWLAGIFFVITFVLSVLYAHRSMGGSSLSKELKKSAPAAATAPAVSPAPAVAGQASPAGSPARQDLRLLILQLQYLRLRAFRRRHRQRRPPLRPLSRGPLVRLPWRNLPSLNSRGQARNKERRFVIAKLHNRRLQTAAPWELHLPGLYGGFRQNFLGLQTGPALILRCIRYMRRSQAGE